MSNDDLVTVQVPRSRLLEVYALLGRPQAADQEADSVTEETGGPSVWPDALVARAYRESSPKMKAFLDYLADRPDARLKAAELADAVGYKPHQFAGLLGAFGRRTKNRYRNPGGHWFFGAEWSSDEWSWIYWMPVEVAEVIKSQRS